MMGGAVPQTATYLQGRSSQAVVPADDHRVGRLSSDTLAELRGTRRWYVPMYELWS